MKGSRLSPRSSPRSSPRLEPGPYAGRRQPHKSRRTRVLNSQGGPSSHDTPGPGQYTIKPEADRLKSPRLSAVRFNKAKRFNITTTNDIADLYGKPIPLYIRPALGEQILSTRATRGSACFGKGTRRAANISATRTGRQGIDSPGPIYHPKEDTRGLEKRYGIRPECSARNRMLNFQNSISSSVSSTSSGRSKDRRRPATSSETGSSSLLRSRLLEETAMDIGYNRPGTSFGKSRRPPLFSKDKRYIPGPKYDSSNTRLLSTDRSVGAAHFGSSEWCFPLLTSKNFP